MIRKITAIGALILFWVLIFSHSWLSAAETAIKSDPFHLKTSEKDIHKGSAILILNADLSGNIFIYDLDDLLVVELTKDMGREIAIGLDEGKYRLTNVVGGDVYKSEITLIAGESVKLKSEDLEKIDFLDDTPKEEPPVSIRKEALLGDKIETHFFGEIGSKSTEIDGKYALLLGGSIGLTFNRSFSVGFAGYGRAITEDGSCDFDIDYESGQPAYGGVTFGYTLFPEKMIHLRAGALFGAGNYFCRDFLIFEPDVDVVLNISRIARLRLGLSMPFTDRDNVGLDDVIFNLGFQFGK